MIFANIQANQVANAAVIANICYLCFATPGIRISARAAFPNRAVLPVRLPSPPIRNREVFTTTGVMECASFTVQKTKNLTNQKMIKPEKPELWIGVAIVTIDNREGFILSIDIFGNPNISYADDFHTEPWKVSWRDIYPIDTPWTEFYIDSTRIENISDWIWWFDKADRSSRELYDAREIVLTKGNEFSTLKGEGVWVCGNKTLRQFFIANRMELI